MALYKIKNGGLKAISQKDFGADNYEERLEDLLEKTPQIPEGEEVLFIGRQVDTKYGIIDLLALNIDGEAIIIELKRGVTPREVVAQALGYAAWINQLDYGQLNELARKYYLARQERFTDLLSIFKERFGIDESGTEESVPFEFNKKQRIYIIAQDISEDVISVARFLRVRGVDIACIKFTYHSAESGEEIFDTEWVVGREEVGEARKEIPRGPGKYDEFFDLFRNELINILTPELQPSYFGPAAGKNYRQVRYPGFGAVHYELRFLKEKLPQPSLEVALHKESSQYDGFLSRFLKDNRKAFLEKLGDDWKAERWGTKCERLYKLIPLENGKELDSVLARSAALQMKNFIENTYHLLSKRR